MRKPQWALVALFGLAVIQILHYYPLLPDTLASHFDGAGKPNGFQPRAAFFQLYAFVLALLFTVFLILPKVLGRLPDAFINLPNKDYWLSPERRRETLAGIEDGISWMGALTMLLMLFMMEFTIRTNLGGHPALPLSVMVSVLVLFVAATLVWTVRFIARFKRPAP